MKKTNYKDETQLTNVSVHVEVGTKLVTFSL